MIRPGTADDAPAVAHVQIASWFPPIVADVRGEIVGFVAVGWATDGLDKDAEFWGMSGRVVRYAKKL